MADQVRTTKAQTKREKMIAFVEASERAGEHKKIRYGDAEIMAPVSEIEQMIETFRTNTPEANRRVIASVKACLANHMPRVMAGKASQKIAMQCAQDIAIWFANEVVEGRAVLRLQ